jgi:hypothetical protein
MRGLIERRCGIFLALLVSACASNQPPQLAKLSVQSAQSGSPASSNTSNGAATNPTSALAPASTGPVKASGAGDTTGGASADDGATSGLASPAATPSVAPLTFPTNNSTGGGTSAPTPVPTPSQGDAGGGTGNGGATGAGTGTSATPIPVVTPTPTPAPVAAVPNVTTFAGNGQIGFIDTNGVDARFTKPQTLVAKGTTALFVSDGGDHRIRRIGLGVAGNPVTTIAGTGASGFRDGIGQAAAFNAIRGLAMDGQGFLYVSDSGNTCIRRVDLTDLSNAVVTTFAGVHGAAGHKDDLASAATFNGVGGLAVVGNTLYVADANNRCIRAIDLASPGNPVTTYAGSGTNGVLDGPATTAQFKAPDGLAADGQGNLFVSDTASHSIRMISAIDPAHGVKTIAGSGNALFQNGNGTSASFNGPKAMAIGPDGNLYVSDTGNNAVRVIKLADPLYPVTTYAGTGVSGFVDAAAPNAQFKINEGITWVGSGLYLADGGNVRIRNIK